MFHPAAPLQLEDFCPARVWGLGQRGEYNCMGWLGCPHDNRLTYVATACLAGSSGPRQPQLQACCASAVAGNLSMPSSLFTHTLCPCRRPLWELICAGPGPWSPKRNHAMPPAFKAAARALLLTAHRSAASSACVVEGGTRTRRAARQHAAAALGALPPALLQHVLRLAAAPVTAWVALGE